MRASILLEQGKDLIIQLRALIDAGDETDAFKVFKRIIADYELRKFPYYFEIEMRIVDNLNAMLKRNFRALVREQVDVVFEKLVTSVRDALEPIKDDVGYDPHVSESLSEVVRSNGAAFREQVDGVVMGRAAHLESGRAVAL